MPAMTPAEFEWSGTEHRSAGNQRHGATDLLAALNVATGEVITDCRKQHGRRRAAVLPSSSTSMSPATSTST